MNIALCYENVNPARGGCETYIADLTRRLVGDRHDVHLYACRWDAGVLPAALHYHRLVLPNGPRFLRPWRFGAACLAELKQNHHDVSVGFDKTWGQDVLYPQGGLHAASAAHNLQKHASTPLRLLARLGKLFDPAAGSFAHLERRQYLGKARPTIIANSEMVRSHFRHYYGIPSDQIHVVHAAVDPDRFHANDRPKIRQEWREQWGVSPQETAALFVAMNYRLKGLEPLLRAMSIVPKVTALKLVVAGHPKTSRYQRLARHLGVADRVIFHGFCAVTRNAYFAADFLVHPTFYDPCSLVALEAMACGLPVVTTQFNGARELLPSQCNHLTVADPHDRDALAASLVRLTEAGTRSACARASREAANAWTFDDHYRKLLGILERTAAAKRAA